MKAKAAEVAQKATGWLPKAPTARPPPSAFANDFKVTGAPTGAVSPEFTPVDIKGLHGKRALIAQTSQVNGLSESERNSNSICSGAAIANALVLSGKSPAGLKANADALMAESILLLFPNAPYDHLKEILFLKETNEHIAIWEGEKLTKERAFEVSGVKTVIWLQDFHKTLKEIMAYAETIYINTNEHYRASIETETREARFVKWWKENYPAHKVEKSNPILQRLRSIKESEEIDLIQKACDITEKGYRRVLNFVKPNVMEYEIEAEFAA